ncbi:CBS domain-containing protein [Streptomyces sp. NPDC008163]|uniref:CBS domain-containing protein n=1 Tax=Streptomyces sp. NPDC008163 TaxID=3364818 RepID=UPI0036ED6F59
MTTQRFTVADVMTKRLVAVLPGAEFKEIAATMERWGVSAVPVLDGEKRVVGIVSEGDLLLKQELHGRRLGLVEELRRVNDTAKAGSRRADDLMTSPAVTITPGSSLPQAARSMATHHVKRLPVVDEAGRVQGMVSRSDLLKVFLRPDEELADEVRHEVVAHLFPRSHRSVEVRVVGGVVTMSGTVRDATLIPVAARLARTVEGVVDVQCELAAGSSE